MKNNSPVLHHIPVMEAFYTLQGEGAFTGTAAWFVRLAGCDVGCTWCDVKESWNVTPEQERSVTDIVQQAAASPARTVVITGGEPCMYDLNLLTEEFHKSGFRVHLETSGAYPVKGNFDWICLSPKKFKTPLEENLMKADELKVVVYNRSDFDWAEKHAAFVREDCRLFLQPEHGVMDKMMPSIIEYVKEKPRWNLSLQTHKFIGIP